MCIRILCVQHSHRSKQLSDLTIIIYYITPQLAPKITITRIARTYVNTQQQLAQGTSNNFPFSRTIFELHRVNGKVQRIIVRTSLHTSEVMDFSNKIIDVRMNESLAGPLPAVRYHNNNIVC